MTFVSVHDLYGIHPITVHVAFGFWLGVRAHANLRPDLAHDDDDGEVDIGNWRAVMPWLKEPPALVRVPMQALFDQPMAHSQLGANGDLQP